MSIKDDIISLLNVVYRQDEFINDFTGAVSSVFETLINFCNSIKNNFFFDSLDIDGVLWWEKLLNIVPSDDDLIYRRAKIGEKWRSNRHNDIKLIQDVCNAWRNGEVKAEFYRALRKGQIHGVMTKSELQSCKKSRFINDGKIQIEFISAYGIPPDLATLKARIEDIKPAHLPLIWIYNFLLKSQIDNVITKTQMETYRKNQFCNI